MSKGARLKARYKIDDEVELLRDIDKLWHRGKICRVLAVRVYTPNVIRYHLSLAGEQAWVSEGDLGFQQLALPLLIEGGERHVTTGE